MNECFCANVLRMFPDSWKTDGDDGASGSPQASSLLTDAHIHETQTQWNLACGSLPREHACPEIWVRQTETRRHSLAVDRVSCPFTLSHERGMWVLDASCVKIPGIHSLNRTSHTFHRWSTGDSDIIYGARMALDPMFWRNSEGWRSARVKPAHLSFPRFRGFTAARYKYWV